MSRARGKRSSKTWRQQKCYGRDERGVGAVPWKSRAVAAVVLGRGGVKERKKIDRRVRKTPTLLRLIRQAARKRTEAVHARRRRRSLVGLPPRPRSFATVYHSRCCRIVRACLFDPTKKKEKRSLR